MTTRCTATPRTARTPAGTASSRRRTSPTAWARTRRRPRPPNRRNSSREIRSPAWAPIRPRWSSSTTVRWPPATAVTCCAPGHRGPGRRARAGAADKPSRFGGRTAHVTHDFLYTNGHGQVVTIQRGTWINAERHTSEERSADKQPAPFDPYTDDQIAEIDAAYDAETRRGPRPRYFEDVEVGEEIQPRVKGPLVVTDLMVGHLGWGMQLTPPGAFGIARKIRRKAPGLYPPNARNI